MQPTIIGEQFGPWLLEEQLGKGATAQVYLAQHQYISGRKAAIKVLSQATDETSRERFLREAQAINALNHPNIVQLIDFAIEERYQTPYMVQEFLEGRDLAELLLEQPDLPKSTIWTIAKQICAGLGAVHSEGLVHRDLKPSNLFTLPKVAPFPLLKILDFGIAKHLDSRTAMLEGSDDKAMKNLTGKLVVGTLSYIAPEQVDTRQPVTPQADIYAFGVLLYELFTGKVPIKGKGFLAHSFELLRDERPYARQFRPELAGTAIEDLLYRMIQKDPVLRPASVEEVAEALGAAITAFADPRDPDASTGRDDVVETQRAAGWVNEKAHEDADEAQTAAWPAPAAALPAQELTTQAQHIEGLGVDVGVEELLDQTFSSGSHHPPPSLHTLSDRPTDSDVFLAAQSSPDTAIAPAPAFSQANPTEPEQPSEARKMELGARLDEERLEDPLDSTMASPKKLPTWLLGTIVVTMALALGIVVALVLLPAVRSGPPASCLRKGLTPLVQQTLDARRSAYQESIDKGTIAKAESAEAIGQRLAAMSPRGLDKRGTRLAKKLLARRLNQCHCYSRKASLMPSLRATVWATLGLIAANPTLHRTAISKQVAFLLKEQSLAGFWMIHPSAQKAASNASLYVTVLSIWTLHKAHALTGESALKPALRAQVQSAKRQAIRWLYKAQWQGQPKWKPYPFNHANKVATSSSAMAIFGLSLSATKHASARYAKLAKAWAIQLLQTPAPKLAGPSGFDSHPNLRVRQAKQTIADKSRYAKWPWLMLAVGVVYNTLSPKLRKRVIQWTTRAIETLPSKPPDPERAATSLLGLQRLLCE